MNLQGNMLLKSKDNRFLLYLEGKQQHDAIYCVFHESGFLFFHFGETEMPALENYEVVAENVQLLDDADESSQSYSYHVVDQTLKTLVHFGKENTQFYLKSA